MTIPGIGGRPRKFTNPYELEENIISYFNSCWEYGIIITKYGALRDQEVIVTFPGDSSLREGKRISQLEVDDINSELSREGKREIEYSKNGKEKTYVRKWKQKKPYSIEGLTTYLRTYRDVILDYENGKYDDREECKDLKYSNIIKEYKAVIDGDTVNRILTDPNSNLRFYAINRLGMRNEQHITSDNNTKIDGKHEINGDMVIEIVPRDQN